MILLYSPTPEQIARLVGDSRVRAQWDAPGMADSRDRLSGQCPDTYNKGIQDQPGGAP